jgi:hypothetical protein
VCVTAPGDLPRATAFRNWPWVMREGRLQREVARSHRREGTGD